MEDPHGADPRRIQVPCGASWVPGRERASGPATITGGTTGRPAECRGATVGVLQRFERRLEGMVGLAFARIFKGKVHPAEIAKALQREADEQRSVLGEGRVLAPNVYIVSLGTTDFEHLGQWSDQLADELADMVTEHIDDEGYQVFDKVTVRLEQDDDLATGVFEVSSHVAGPPPARFGGAPAAPPPPRPGPARHPPGPSTGRRPPPPPPAPAAARPDAV